jgi:hypothetical protein
MIIIDDYPQLSDKWFSERLGNPGASNFDKILSNVHGRPSKSAEGYVMQLAGEVVSGRAEERFVSRDMERGIELEPEARDRFKWDMSMDVRQVALCYPDDKRKYHCSPDGLCSDGGGLEIKSPKLKTHIGYMLGKEFPKKDYNAQVQGSLLVTGLPHWWFMSYYPDIKPFIIKVVRDEEYIEKLRVALDIFCQSLASMIIKIR